MKANHILKLAILFVTLTTLSSCAVVGGIFKTGMGVGAIAVILIIVLVIFFLAKAGKK